MDDDDLLAGVVTGEQLGQLEFDPLRAGELISTADCTPRCLLAIETPPWQCECVCNGQYHGQLVDAVVDGRA